jgi:PAS domain S-box-containing protein
MTVVHDDHHWLHLILENISDAIIVLDRRRLIRYANSGAALMAGVPSGDDLLGASYEEYLSQNRVYDEKGDVIDPASYPSNIAFETGVATNDKIIRQVNLRDGRQYWLKISTATIEDENGEVRFVIVFYGDVTVRKSSDDRLRFLVESEKILSLTTDFHTRLEEKALLLVPLMADWSTINIVNEDGSLARVAVVHRDPAKRDMVEEFARLSAQEAQAQSGVRHVIETGKAELYPFLSDDFLVGTSVTPERLALARALGPCSAMIIPIISRSKVLGALSLSYAESGRRYSESDLQFMQEFGYHLGVLADNARLYQEIEKRDKAKDSFLATLSHELRNPLAPIRSSLELLHTTETDPETLEQIGIIEHQFDTMTHLLNDLLDVTRYTQGKIELEPKILDLCGLVEQVMKGNQSFLFKKDITTHVSLPADPVIISADETRLEQAFTNILQNAEKFTPEHGNVWIEVTIKGTEAMIVIRDDGIGIDPADLKKIFELHYQGSHEAVRHKSGLGLGLVIVREIVRLHGGEVRAESEGEGHGSRFVITLPLARPEAHVEQPDPGAHDAIRAQVQKILVTDDNQAAAQGLKMLLEHAGHETRIAHDGAQAIALARGFRPATVLLDIGLPDMDGYEVASRIREVLGNDTTLVALTGYGQEGDKQKAEEAGFDFHLTKPASINEIKAILAQRKSPAASA